MRAFLTMLLIVIFVDAYAQQKSLTGVYGYLRHGKKVDLSTGRIDVIQLAGDKVKYQLGVNTFRDHYGGKTGIIGIENNRAVHSYRTEFSDTTSICKLIFHFNGDTLTLKQEGSYWDCGFGYGIYADGVYIKIKKEKPALEGWGITVDNDGSDYRVKADKVIFYKDSSLSIPTDYYLVKGDKISTTSLAPSSEQSVYVEYYNSKKVKFTYGWLPIKDLEEIR